MDDLPTFTLPKSITPKAGAHAFIPGSTAMAISFPVCIVAQVGRAGQGKYICRGNYSGQHSRRIMTALRPKG